MAEKDGDAVQVPTLDRGRTAGAGHREAQVTSKKDGAEATGHGRPGHPLAMCLYYHSFSPSVIPHL